MLTEDHKLQRVEISQRVLLRCQQENRDEDTTHIGVGPGGDFRAKNNLFDNLIRGDKTWVHLNTQKTKRESMTWKHTSSPVTKKFKVQRRAAKVMATVFWDAKGVILLDILLHGQFINAAQYCSTLDRLRDAIRHKRPGLLRRGVELQHDKVTPHSANLTQQWLFKLVFLILPTVYTSHLLTFIFFGPLKRHLGDMAFETEGDLVGGGGAAEVNDTISVPSNSNSSVAIFGNNIVVALLKHGSASHLRKEGDNTENISTGCLSDETWEKRRAGLANKYWRHILPNEP
ncbi:histone-lysine N-methyltransferase SETMAR [Elysia marginata]|uniref:Histone-lysine N-methyltransferase SETMAR n=1 Tax=Elysia marginata TaxID=1093978 RepID=A0AAV4JHD3_9GAST|nr:histone-lysine N-methyltransferase SETMAR [Elysia marginata]